MSCLTLAWECLMLAPSLNEFLINERFRYVIRQLMSWINCHYHFHHYSSYVDHIFLHVSIFFDTDFSDLWVSFLCFFAFPLIFLKIHVSIFFDTDFPELWVSYLCFFAFPFIFLKTRFLLSGNCSFSKMTCSVSERGWKEYTDFKLYWITAQ